MLNTCIHLDNLKMVHGMQQSRRCHSSPITIPVEDHLEVKSGSLEMIQSCNKSTVRVPVFARVYRNSYEHYAVIYRDQKFTNSSIYIGLKHSVVYKNDNNENEIRVIPDNMEGSKLTFFIKETSEVDDWVSALQSNGVSSPTSTTISPSLSPVIPRAPLMPTLQELEEENE